MLPRDPFQSAVKALDQQAVQNNLQQQQKQARAAREKQVAKYKQEDEAAERARAQQREADRRARVDAEEAALRARYEAIWLSQPGSRASDFAREWPAILKRIQIEAVLGTGQTVAEEYSQMRREQHISGLSE